jgi:hypothetical protein
MCIIISSLNNLSYEYIFIKYKNNLALKQIKNLVKFYKFI